MIFVHVGTFRFSTQPELYKKITSPKHSHYTKTCIVEGVSRTPLYLCMDKKRPISTTAHSAIQLSRAVMVHHDIYITFQPKIVLFWASPSKTLIYLLLLLTAEGAAGIYKHRERLLLSRMSAVEVGKPGVAFLGKCFSWSAPHFLLAPLSTPRSTHSMYKSVRHPSGAPSLPALTGITQA